MKTVASFLSLLFAGILASMGVATAADLAPVQTQSQTKVQAQAQIALGQQLLQENCSRCHAIGMEGDSSHDKAPPFRHVMKVYGADSLQEALAEGLVTGHPDMPEFVFPPEQVGAIIAYLHTLEPKT